MANLPTLLAAGLHRLNGSPVYPGGQLHMARRLRASHWALMPQVPDSQMLTQREAEHCCETPQSSSLEHCGPHPVIVSGLGKNPALQRQMATPSELTLHSVLGPHGYGVQGSTLIKPIRLFVYPHLVLCIVFWIPSDTSYLLLSISYGFFWGILDTLFGSGILVD